MRKKSKEKSISELKREADRVFSIWIRKRDPKCFTCGAPSTQAAHYVSRSWLALRYHPINVSGSCYRCNIVLRGNMDVYALKLVETYGDGVLNMLAKMKKPTQFKVKDYQDIINRYDTN